MQDIAFRTLLYRYFFFGWLFKDASRGNVIERAAAWRHNKERAHWLLTYLRRWLWCTRAAVRAGGPGRGCAAVAGALGVLLHPQRPRRFGQRRHRRSVARVQGAARPVLKRAAIRRRGDAVTSAPVTASPTAPTAPHPLAPRPLWRTFLVFLGPMSCQHPAVALGHAQQHLRRPDAGHARAGGRVGHVPDHVLLYLAGDRHWAPARRC